MANSNFLLAPKVVTPSSFKSSSVSVKNVCQSTYKEHSKRIGLLFLKTLKLGTGKGRSIFLYAGPFFLWSFGLTGNDFTSTDLDLPLVPGIYYNISLILVSQEVFQGLKEEKDKCI